MTNSLAVLDGMRQSEWIEQCGISRSQAFLLLKGMCIQTELRRVPGSNKPQPFIIHSELDRLNGAVLKIRDGMPLKEALAELGFANPGERPKPLPVKEPKPIDWVKALTPPADPLKLAKQLKEASELGIPLTNDEMAAVLGRTEMKPQLDGMSPRPGFTIHRQEFNGRPFWTVRCHAISDRPSLRATNVGFQTQGIAASLQWTKPVAANL